MERREVIAELNEWANSYDQPQPEFDGSPTRIRECVELLREAVALLIVDGANA